jgi:hypothetical protein
LLKGENDMRWILLTGAAIAAAIPASAPAASDFYGVQTLASLRNCGGAGPTDECPGGQRLRPFASAGGLWQANAASGYVETRDIAQKGSFGEGRGELAGDGLNLPILHAVSSATTDARVNGSALGFASYTYTGAAPQQLSLKSTLTVDASEASPDNPLLPGGAFVSFYIGIFDTGAFVRDYVDVANRSINIGPVLDCGTDGLLAFGSAQPAAVGGAFNVSATTQSCAGGPLFLQPGHSYVVYGNLSMFTNRGGFLDALHTLTTELDPALGEQAIAELRSSLVSSVPEPAEWAMMIGGFGFIGGVARARRYRPLISLS